MSHQHLQGRLKAVFGPLECFGQVAERDVQAAEQALGVCFPPSYREFLRMFGASLGVAPFEIAGLSSSEKGASAGPPLWSSVVHDTIARRRAQQLRFPSAYLAVSSDGCDIGFFIDTSRASGDGESPVVAVGPGHSGEVVARSFIEFAEKLPRHVRVGA